MKKFMATAAAATMIMAATPALAYEVKPGDTMSKIARDHNMSLNSLVSKNPHIRNIHLIYPGDTIHTSGNETVQQSSTEKRPVSQSKPVVSQPSEPVSSQSNSGISQSDKDLLARLIRAEAQSESFDGKVAVGTVVLNRVNSSQFPNTISGVIYQKNQFSPVMNGTINRAADSESIRAAEVAIQMGGSSDGAIFFYNPSIATNSWLNSRTTVKVIGNHVFKK